MKFYRNKAFIFGALICLLMVSSSALMAQAVNSSQTKKVKWVGVRGKDDQFYFLIPESFRTFEETNFYRKEKNGTKIQIDSRRILSRLVNGSVLMLDFYQGDADALRETLSASQKGDLVKDENINGFRFMSFVQKTPDFVWKTQYFVKKKRLYVISGVSRREDDEIVRDFFGSVRLEDQNQFAAPNSPRGTKADAIVEPKEITETVAEQLDDLKPEAHPDRGVIILYKPRPRFDSGTHIVHGSGEAQVRALFSSSGKVTKTEIISSSGRELSEAAIRAAERIQFLPAEKDGKLVSISKMISYSFSTY